MTFCTDMDLLYYEPDVFVSAAAAAQTIVNGSGVLTGSSLATVENLANLPIEARMVAVLSGAANATVAIAQVQPPYAMSISVLHEGLFGEDGQTTPVGLGANGQVSYSVRSFWAQRQIVSDLLIQACRGRDGDDLRGGAAIVNSDAFRKPAVLGTLQMIHNALAAASTDTAGHFAARAEMYERLYRRAMRSVIARIDLDGDGVAEVTRGLNLVEFVRV